MAKIKLTRKSYKRNIIAFGVMLFMGIALVSTGFATWVLSQNTEFNTGNKNVNVGVVSDNALQISDLKFKYQLIETAEDGSLKYKDISESEEDFKKSNFGFYFEPLAGDVDGKVKWDKETYVKNKSIINYEVLTLTITGVINPVDWINTFGIEMILPEGILNLAERKFITLPDFIKYDNETKTFATEYIIDLEGKNLETPYTEANVFTIDNDGKFTLTIEFKWGAVFGSKNPSVYFDTEDYTGAVLEWAKITPEKYDKMQNREKEELKYDYIKYCLQELRKQVHGCTYESIDDVEYEVYEDKGTLYVLKDDGLYYKVIVDENGNSTGVENTVADWEPVQPQFDIKINITAN